MKIQLISKGFCVPFMILFCLAILINNSSAQHVSPMVSNPTNPPGSPGPVTGPSPVGQGSTQTYSVTAASGATSYTWSLSNSTAGTLSSTTTSVSIHWNASFAGSVFISCSAVNLKGSTPGTGLTVQVTAPITPLISGIVSPKFQNINNTGTPAAITSTASTGGNGVYSYMWQSSNNNSTWANISYATGSSFNPSNTGTNEYYRLITTSGTQSVTSNTAFISNMVSSSYSPSNNIVSVNELTGTANVVIPLYTLKAAHVDFPINLVYSATGIKGTDMEGNAGMGWNVSLGGSVTRHLRGLPDDVSRDNLGNAAAGWLFNTNMPDLSQVHFANDNNTSTCNDEGTDIALLNSTLFPANTDSEPDLFQVNAPGLSCQLVFDQTAHIHIIPYQDLKVSYTSSASGNPDQGQITSFTITNDQGITYTFSAIADITQMATTTLSSVNYFTRNYNAYKNGISYHSAWGLTSISDIHGNSIILSYTTAPSQNFTNPVQVSVGGGLLTTEYTMKGSTTYQNVTGISLNTSILNQGQSFQINYGSTPASKQQVITSMTGMGHNFIFGYNYVTSTNSQGNFVRFFLNSIIDELCSAQNVNGQMVALSSYAPLNLTFNYLHTGNTFNTTSSLASPSAYNVDYWGYTNSVSGNTSLLPSIDINPSTNVYERYRNRQVASSPSGAYIYQLTNSNREADQNCTIGTLNQINYPEGGYTAISYEPNDYYDNTAQATVQGGGIRVTQVLDHDGITTDNDFIKNYTYRDASGNSTGRALSLPTFVFTTPYATGSGLSQWTSSTIFSPIDLSTEDHAILYNSVTETINNTGSTIYKYAVPATNWDPPLPSGTNPPWHTNTMPTWSQTSVDVGRSPGSGSLCQAEGVLKNDVNTYPFPPNVNYDFERGMLTNVLQYNSSGTQVSETDYYYQTTDVPLDIAAIKFDNNSFATNYTKYYIHTGISPVITQVINKLFDLTNVTPGSQPTAATSITTNYSYTPQHKVNQKLILNADGSSTTSHIKYIKDYGLITAGDSYTTALLALQNDNLNTPVESYTQFTPIGGGQAYTTNAQLVLFGTFPNQGIAQTHLQISGPGTLTYITATPGPAPLQRLGINSVSGVTDLAVSSIANAGSNPTFVYDIRYYKVVENELGYDYSGALLSSNDNYSHIKTNVFDNLNSFRLRATINNASYDQIGMDYPGQARLNGGPVVGYGTPPNAYSFSSPSNPYLYANGPSRNGESSLTLPASQALTKSINRNPYASNYIFSIWVNTSNAGSFTVSLTDGTNSSTKSFNYDVTSGNSKYPTGFEYCQVLVPVSSLSKTSPVTVNFSCTTDINFTDVMTYPDIATVASYAYDNNQNVISSTDGNGISTYYNYDLLGRLTYVYDQDLNIVQRKTYVNNNAAINSPPLINLSWTNPPPGLNGVVDNINFATSITTSNTCTFDGNATYAWNFGDGSANVSGVNITAISHEYTGNPGQQFTCTLTITSPNNSAAPYSVSSVVTLNHAN